jgi:hypothetical protein
LCADTLELVTLKIRQITIYRFNEQVSLLPHRLMLRPRQSRDLRLISTVIMVAPDAALSWAYDVFGNAAATATFRTMASHARVRSVFGRSQCSPNDAEG